MIYITNTHVHIAGIGLVRLKEKGYVSVEKDGKTTLSQITVSRQADHWFISFLLREEVPDVTKVTWEVTVLH